MLKTTFFSVVTIVALIAFASGFILLLGFTAASYTTTPFMSLVTLLIGLAVAISCLVLISKSVSNLMFPPAPKFH